MLSCVRLLETPGTVAHQAPLSVEFSKQEYWTGLLLFSRRSSQPWDWTWVSCIAWGILNQLSHQGSPLKYYSVLKRNEQSSHEETQGKLKSIFLSERNQYEKATYLMIPTILTFWKRQNYGDSKKERSVVTMG